MFIQLIIISIHFLFNSQNFIAHPFCFLGEISHEPQCDFYCLTKEELLYDCSVEYSSGSRQDYVMSSFTSGLKLGMVCR